MRTGLAFLSVTALLFGCTRKDAPPLKGGASDSPADTSPASLVDDLGEEYDLGDYRIRPPKGFELKSDDDAPHAAGRLVVWRSADDQRGFSVAVLTFPTEVTPEKVRVLGRPKGMADVDESPGGHETIGGLDFDWCTTGYTFRGTEKRYASLVYSHARGSKGILITYSSPPAEDDRRVRVALAAIRSFRKP